MKLIISNLLSLTLSGYNLPNRAMIYLSIYMAVTKGDI